MGRRKWAPIAARNTFGSQASTQPIGRENTSLAQFVIQSPFKVDAFCNRMTFGLTFGEQDILAAGGGRRAQDGSHVARVSDVVTDQGQWHGVAGLWEGQPLRVRAREYGWRKEEMTDGQLG